MIQNKGGNQYSIVIKKYLQWWNWGLEINKPLRSFSNLTDCWRLVRRSVRSFCKWEEEEKVDEQNSMRVNKILVVMVFFLNFKQYKQPPSHYQSFQQSDKLDKKETDMKVKIGTWYVDGTSEDWWRCKWLTLQLLQCPESGGNGGATRATTMRCLFRSNPL